MKRTTVFLEEDVEKDLQALARRKGRPTADIVREALARYVAEEKRKTGADLSILAMGRSGRRNTAETHEQLLWAEFDPHGGGRPGRRAGTKGRASVRSPRKK